MIFKTAVPIFGCSLVPITPLPNVFIIFTYHPPSSKYIHFSDFANTITMPRIVSLLTAGAAFLVHSSAAPTEPGHLHVRDDATAASSAGGNAAVLSAITAIVPTASPTSIPRKTCPEDYLLIHNG
jgi:hypothetical protein